MRLLYNAYIGDGTGRDGTGRDGTGDGIDLNAAKKFTHPFAERASFAE